MSNSATGTSTLNSYGYSPHPLSTYLQWIKEIILQHPESMKPFIISITSSDPKELGDMVSSVQMLRQELADIDLDGKRSIDGTNVTNGADVVNGTNSKGSKDSRSPSHERIAIEVNTSCPNIPHKPPPAYDMPALLPLLQVLAEHYRQDPSLTIGLKLPPYVYAGQFGEVVGVIASLSSTTQVSGKRNVVDDGREERRGADGGMRNPIAFLTCTNTLGSSLMFEDQVQSREVEVDIDGNTNADRLNASTAESTAFALPTPLGGLAGSALHSLALGNVYSFARTLVAHPNPAMRAISIIGVGGVLDKQGAERMRRAGAQVVGCATLLGMRGVQGFEVFEGM
jgi:dihydroorotate dehydrogenase (fumarate)